MRNIGAEPRSQRLTAGMQDSSGQKGVVTEPKAAAIHLVTCDRNTARTFTTASAGIDALGMNISTG